MNKSPERLVHEFLNLDLLWLKNFYEKLNSSSSNKMYFYDFKVCYDLPNLGLRSAAKLNIVLPCRNIFILYNDDRISFSPESQKYLHSWDLYRPGSRKLKVDRLGLLHSTKEPAFTNGAISKFYFHGKTLGKTELKYLPLETKLKYIDHPSYGNSFRRALL